MGQAESYTGPGRPLIPVVLNSISQLFTDDARSSQIVALCDGTAGTRTVTQK
jgi:hypothetical protein